MGGKRKKDVEQFESYTGMEPSADEMVAGEKAEMDKFSDGDDQEAFREEVKTDLENADLLVTKEEKEAVAKDFGLNLEQKIKAINTNIESVEISNLGNLRHKECYCVMSGKDNIVMAFIPDAFEPKFRGKIFQVIGEAGLSMENATTLSASTLFDRQVKPEEKPDPQKPLFDEPKE